MCERRRPDERGVALVETLVAGAILTFALVALAELLGVSIRMHQIGRNSTSAVRLAQDKFEELMKLNFATAPAIQVNGADTLAADVPNYFDVPANSGYTRRWSVVAHVSGNAALRTVTVRLVPDVPVGADYQVTTVLRSW